MRGWVRIVTLACLGNIAVGALRGMHEFWISVYATIAAALILGSLGWLAQRFWVQQAARQLPSSVAIVFDGSSAQFKRYDTVRSGELKQTRTVYVLGVTNRSGATLHGVQCFVLGVDEYSGIQERRPLQPVGLPAHAERIDVPPSTNNQPSAYFEFVETYSQEADGGWVWLCVPYGENQLPFIANVTVSLEGDGFQHEARFNVANRRFGYFDEQQEWHDVEMIPLTVTRLP